MRSCSPAAELLEPQEPEVRTRWDWAWEFADDAPSTTPDGEPMREVTTRWDWAWEFDGEVTEAA